MSLATFLSLVWAAFKTYFNGVVYSFRELNRHVRQDKLDFSSLPDDLSQRCVFITGVSRGIGLHVAQALLKRGCHVIGTTSSDVDAAKRSVLTPNTSRGRLEVLQLDLTSLQSVVAASKKVTRPLNALLMNSGVMFAGPQLTGDGIETHAQLNFVGHALLFALLEQRLLEGAEQSKNKARVVWTSSGLHRSASTLDIDSFTCLKHFNAYSAYAQSKLAQIAFSNRLARHFSDKRLPIVSVSLHPGVCRTSLMHGFSWFSLLEKLPLFRDAVEGAETPLFCLLCADADRLNGCYLEDCAETRPSEAAEDRQSQEKLWHWTWNTLKPQTGADLYKLLTQ